MNHSRIELEANTTLLVWEGVVLQQIPGGGRTTLSLRPAHRRLRTAAFRFVAGTLAFGLGGVLLVLSAAGLDALLRERIGQAELAALMSAPATPQAASMPPAQQAAAPAQRAPTVVRPDGAAPQRRDNAFGLLD